MNTSIRSGGFTLVELMVVVAIMAIVASIAVPSFNTMIKNNRLTAAVNDLSGALNYARSEAVRRGRTVQVDALSGDLSNGLRVWFDADGDGNFDDDDSEELRLVRLSSSADFDVEGDVDGSTKTDISLSYSARGSVGGGGNQFKLTLCDDRNGNYGKELSLLATGVLRLTSSITCS